MATFLHPASLNPFQQYRQACAILRNTTRASNPAWYQDARELNFQLHVRPDGPGIATAYYDRKQDQWSAGPALNEAILDDPEKTASVVGEVLKKARSSGATSIGVILHIADEFATAELKPELDNPAALPDLRDAAVNDPGSVLDDSTIAATEASWRVLPYPAAGSEAIGTTITISRAHDAFLQALRGASGKSGFPVITRAFSAPLVAMSGLCQSVSATPGKPFVAILQYPWFTVLSFFNEHADLQLIRTLQHRGVRRASNLRSALSTTCASLEYLEPDFFLLPLGEEIDSSLEATLKVAFAGSRVETVGLPDPAGISQRMPEAVICSKPTTESDSEGASETLRVLRDENWATQDFLPVARETAELYPDRGEMKMLRMLRLGRVAIFAIVVLFLAYFSLGVVDLMRKPEWAFNPSQADTTQNRLAMLTQERQKAEHWNNLMADRSKTWVAMEALSRLFPENGGVLVKNYNHSAKPETAAGMAKVGFVKEWKITGFARDDAYEYLNSLNTREGIAGHFGEIARITSNEAFDPEIGNRNITVNVRMQENNSFKPVPLEETSIADESSYPFTFDLTITQRFEATDPLAIAVPKAP